MAARPPDRLRDYRAVIERGLSRSPRSAMRWPRSATAGCTYCAPSRWGALPRAAGATRGRMERVELAEGGPADVSDVVPGGHRRVAWRTPRSPGLDDRCARADCRRGSRPDRAGAEAREDQVCPPVPAPRSRPRRAT